MMRRRFSLSLAILVLLPALLAGQSSKSSSSKKTPAKTAAPAAPAKSAPKKKVARKPAAKRARPAPVPVAQLKPTKDRYAEIQRALADAGYFTGEPNGLWGDDSAAALLQFQWDQGLDPTGKIDALSLTRLNLGPHYDNAGDGAKAGADPPG